MPKLPSLSGERVIRALKRAGFVELRQKGSHVSLEKRTSLQIWKTIVPMHPEVGKRHACGYSEAVRTYSRRILGTSLGNIWPLRFEEFEAARQKYRIANSH